MELKIKSPPHEKPMIIAIFAISTIFFGVGIYGTYYSTPDSRAFYIYYILITISSVIIGNIVVPLLQKPTSDLLIQETNKQIHNLYSLMSSLRELGVSGITISIPDINWTLLISESQEIKLAFKSNVNWLSSNKEVLSEFLKKKNSCLKVILPDPDVEDLCIQLAAQRKESVEHIKGDIEGAVSILKEISTFAPKKVEIRLSSTIFVSHLYIFSSKSIVTIRTIDRWRSPHIVCDGSDPGRTTLYRFCCDQFEELWKHRSREKKI